MARPFSFLTAVVVILITIAVSGSAQQFQSPVFYNLGATNAEPGAVIAVDLNNDGNRNHSTSPLFIGLTQNA